MPQAICPVPRGKASRTDPNSRYVSAGTFHFRRILEVIGLPSATRAREFRDEAAFALAAPNEGGSRCKEVRDQRPP
jgi:hypothetical protein